MLVGYRLYYRELPVNSTPSTVPLEDMANNTTTRGDITGNHSLCCSDIIHYAVVTSLVIIHYAVVTSLVIIRYY